MQNVLADKCFERLARPDMLTHELRKTHLRFPNRLRLILTVALAGLVGILLPVSARSESSIGRPAPIINGIQYVSLQAWASYNRMAFRAPRGGEKSAEVTARWGRATFLLDSRSASINGVNIWLSHSVREDGGRILIAERDMRTVLQPILLPKPPAKPKKIRTITLDAGHGGKDPGFKLGARSEKDYTLSLAHDLRDMLLAAGFRVIMTRTSDTYPELEDRPTIARRAGSDLFVSLHYNCAPDAPDANGVEVYCATPLGTSSTNGGGPKQQSEPSNRYDDQSILLAYEAQKSIVRSLQLNDRGVRRAGFIVLNKAPMPGILIEGGFMSNRDDAKKIFDRGHRQQMARAIVDAILSYKRQAERGLPPQ